MEMDKFLRQQKSMIFFPYSCSMLKAVERGDKTTQRVRVRVFALIENPRRDQVLDPARLQKPRRERVLDCWFEARGSVDILILVPWFEYGTRTRMSTDG